ncbi:MAG: E3 binding domain-containing protein [Rhizobiales bacterium]|nr:E3 binding domain-containing protein [Hyphomicrobiales bacterium]
MKTLADLVMPKLGLTMTEGTVAQWAIAPGASFGADDIVAVIETDKIAYEVKAPSAGTLSEILVPTGTTVAVGTPIAQWEPKGVPARDATAAAIVSKRHAPADAAAASMPLPTPPSPATAQAVGARIIATPYARRIARNAGIELAAIPAANNRRIRAADVETAIARRAAAATPAPQCLSAAGFTFIGTEVSVDRLLRLIADIAEGIPGLTPAPVHFVILAAARALADHGVAPVIGLQHADFPPCIFDSDACRRLSTIVAADRAGIGTAAAAMMLLVADNTDATLVARMPLLGCGATLGVGAINRVFRPNAAGAPVLRAELHLVFCLRDAALPESKDLLWRIRELLENPFVLLAI